MSAVAGNGVQLSNIKVNNWTGTEANGAERGPIRVVCADGTPCTGVDLTDIALWTETGKSEWYSCRSAYTDNTGADAYCLHNAAKHTSYAATTTTVTAAPKGYAAPTMAADLATPTWGFTESIPIPAMPTSFFPGTKPLKALAGE